MVVCDHCSKDFDPDGRKKENDKVIFWCAGCCSTHSFLFERFGVIDKPNKGHWGYWTMHRNVSKLQIIPMYDNITD